MKRAAYVPGMYLNLPEPAPGKRLIRQFPLKSAAHREKSREWGRLNAKVEPVLTWVNSGESWASPWETGLCVGVSRSKQRHR